MELFRFRILFLRDRLPFSDGVAPPLPLQIEFTLQQKENNRCQHAASVPDIVIYFTITGGLRISYIVFVRNDPEESRHQGDVDEGQPRIARRPPEVFVAIGVEFYSAFPSDQQCIVRCTGSWYIP